MAPRLQEMFDGWEKVDPPTIKKLPVEVDVSEQIAKAGQLLLATELIQAVGDLALIAFIFS